MSSPPRSGPAAYCPSQSHAWRGDESPAPAGQDTSPTVARHSDRARDGGLSPGRDGIHLPRTEVRPLTGTEGRWQLAGATRGPGCLSGGGDTLVGRDRRDVKAYRPVKQYTPRTCLQCSKPFDSEGPHHRVCDACREKWSKSPSPEHEHPTSHDRRHHA